jgi:hypothetical protein
MSILVIYGRIGHIQHEIHIERMEGYSSLLSKLPLARRAAVAFLGVSAKKKTRSGVDIIGGDEYFRH